MLSARVTLTARAEGPTSYDAKDWLVRRVSWPAQLFDKLVQGVVAGRILLDQKEFYFPPARNVSVTPFKATRKSFHEFVNPCAAATCSVGRFTRLDRRNAARMARLHVATRRPAAVWCISHQDNATAVAPVRERPEELTQGHFDPVPGAARHP